MTECEYGPLVDHLLARAAECGQPAAGTFEITCRCNLECGMCYVRQPAGLRAVARELDAAAWTTLARQAVDAGMVFLLVTGGEPFLRPDFFDIWEPLTRLGLNLTLFTNGTLVGPDTAARLAQCPPNRIEVTLYGADAAAYESVTGVRGSFDRCRTGIDALLERGLPLALKTTLTRANAGQLDAMRALARQWGVPFSAAWLLSRRRDGVESDVCGCRLSPEECVALEASDAASRREWEEMARRTSHPAPRTSHSAPRTSHSFYCLSGRSTFYIGAGGEMCVCADLPMPGARPLEVGFAAAWQELRRYVASGTPAADCDTCEMADFCNRCPAWSHTETGDLGGRPDYLCEIARLRRERYATA